MKSLCNNQAKHILQQEMSIRTLNILTIRFFDIFYFYHAYIILLSTLFFVIHFVYNYTFVTWIDHLLGFKIGRTINIMSNKLVAENSTFTVISILIIVELGFICNSMFFLRLLIIDFVSNVRGSPHDEIDGGVFIFHVFAYFG
ncbi:Uncharacterized protein FWK35_00020625 [Aphis craccivora]|uniref:Uncharacterized protein n=1 Tax=Aphis craccivora TaxID=307492 RepID=A0A6G0XDJ8_APHCR|nr:Uncharacterized protein FWK35_00020625 [Aphis craccivora]